MSGRKLPCTPEEVLEQLAQTGRYAEDVTESLLSWEKRQRFVEMTGVTARATGR